MLIEELMTEARGLLFRQPGDTWRNKEGVEISLEEIIKYPEKGQAEERELNSNYQKMIKAFADQDITDIRELNERKTVTKAFALAVFAVANTDQKIVFVKWLTKIDPDAKGQWDNNDLGGFVFQSTRSSKGRSGIKPANLLPPGEKFANPRALLTALKPKLEAVEHGKEIYDGLNNIVKGQKFFFKVPEAKNAAIRDDFGEIIAPIMLWMGKIHEAENARKAILGDRPWNSCTISFPSTVNAGLLDSVLVSPDGVRIGVSSKGDSGAKASVANIFDGIKALEKVKSPLLRRPYVKKLQEVVDVLIHEKAKDSPLVLALSMGMISKKQAQAVRDSIGEMSFEQDRPSSLLKARRQTTDIQADPLMQLLNAGRIKLGDIVYNSDSYRNRLKNPGYRIGYHALSYIANQVAREINKDTDISKGALAVLNNSPMLQIHLYTKYRANEDPDQAGVEFTKWEVIFPMEFKGQLKLSSEKSYWASGQSGRMTFGFGKSTES